MDLKQNVGTVDRAARGVFAVVFLVLGAFKAQSLLGKVLLGLGALLGATAAVGTCPAYLAADVDTLEVCSVESVKKRLGL